MASFSALINSSVVSKKALRTLPNFTSSTDTIPRMKKFACSVGRGLTPTQIALDSLTRSAGGFGGLVFSGFLVCFFCCF